jgi:hypothetical protein
MVEGLALKKEGAERPVTSVLRQGTAFYPNTGRAAMP